MENIKQVQQITFRMQVAVQSAADYYLFSVAVCTVCINLPNPILHEDSSYVDKTVMSKNGCYPFILFNAKVVRSNVYGQFLKVIHNGP